MLYKNDYKNYCFLERNIRIEISNLNENINFHTMGNYLKMYVFQKFPIEEIKDVIRNNGMFEICNNQLYKLNNFNKYFYKVDFFYKKNRKFNYIRPEFYLNRDQNKFIISLVPGEDYLMHYARMLNFILEKFKYQTNIILKRYIICF